MKAKLYSLIGSVAKKGQTRKGSVAKKGQTRNYAFDLINYVLKIPNCLSMSQISPVRPWPNFQMSICPFLNIRMSSKPLMVA